MATLTSPPVDKTTTARPRGVYTRVEALGLVFIALAPAVMLTAGVLAGLDLSEAGFLLIPLAIGLVGAGLVWRFGTWAKVVGVVLSLAAAMFLFWLAFGLAYPNSFADFVPGTLLPLGVILGVGGGIAAIVRRKRLETGATAGERRLIRIAVGIVFVAAAVSGALHLAGRTSAEATGAAATVTMSEFEFDATTYTVASGGSVLVHNSDPFVHTFTVPELGIDQTILPGSKHLIEVTGDAGTYTIYCRPHSDVDEADPDEAGMAASLTVR